MTSMVHRAAPTFEAVEFRADGKGGDTFVGYAAVFESPSKPIFDPRESRVPFIETITQGAFARTLGMGRKSFVVDHDEKLFLSATDGPLRLGEDSRGLAVESPWPRTDYADNVRALHEAGTPLGMSFTFSARGKGSEWSNGGRSRRVNEAALGHVTVLASLVPAYNETQVAFRALAYRMETDMEQLEELFAAIKEGRDLTDEQKEAFRKLAQDIDPAPEPVIPEPVDPAAEYDAKFADKYGALA